MVNQGKNYFTTSEYAKNLGISRIAVFKRIKKGILPAIKIGRIYAIPKSQTENIIDVPLSENQKSVLDKAIEKTVKDYGQTLKMLGSD